MLPFEEALGRVLDRVPAPISELVPLADAPGRVLTESIQSPIDLPIFDNSAMDGYAVRAADIASATAATPVHLRVVGKVAAGDVAASQVTPGVCMRLFTGSPLPPGADAVVMQEDTRLDPNCPGEVMILAPANPGEYVRPHGEDITQGSIMAAEGEVLAAGRIGLIAAAGLTHISVGRRPVVGLLATGSELMEPGQPLAPGRIYESNRAALAALIKRSGAIPASFPLVADALAQTNLALANALSQCDAVVTSGGVSVGEMDFLKRSFEQIGGELEFWKVAMKPGRPFVFGRYGEKLLFGLPGNPVSAFVTFLLLVRPALLRWQGAAEVSLPVHPGVLAEPLANPGERRHFMRVKVDSTGKVRSAGIQASHVLSSLAAANGLIDMPPCSSLVTGSPVSVLRWEY
jgi:molybdopterin molybdotransferase